MASTVRLRTHLAPAVDRLVPGGATTHDRIPTDVFAWPPRPTREVMT